MVKYTFDLLKIYKNMQQKMLNNMAFKIQKLNCLKF